MWVTEWGWNSEEVGDAAQAAYLAQSIDVLRGAPYIAVAVVFVDYDRDAYPYGLLDRSLRPKPAAAVFAKASTGS